ncbi:exodeoxyribonuclease III [Phaeocystidibacter luteus]|uniref:Exodeoxyribonuclease III n=1 Tax=Phaeocystidibacter luteus TaxID=911197 RepID=A0A6N6RKM8_9FLAO|nr:exodeoxyribonuclease III [Phaeocystidibacter luteus]KAB2808030.1 exodeoxyribonuclease III [Phaeocystidibacter luteus]
MKYISWNVNGVRAAAKKGFAESVRAMNPDAICLQETKATPEQTAEAVADLEEYKVYGYGAERKGYSGTAILTRTEPISVSYGLGIEEHDQEGRVIAAEFEDHYLVTTYVPNSGNGLKRLDYREEWDKAMLVYLQNLEKKKPVIWCGDLNVAHQEIDIARPKSNYNKTAGYTQVEIDGMTRFLESGMIDTFREMHPEEVKYSWWSYRGQAREKNIGWRLDYFLVSKSLRDQVEEAFILNEVEGSDHCPVGLVLSGS